MRRELISNALNKRFIELRGRISELAKDDFDDLSTFVSTLSERLNNASPGELKSALVTSLNQNVWSETDSDCLATLRSVSLGEQLEIRIAQYPPLELFLQHLSASRSDPDLRFQLLAERYSCPLNFLARAEADVREYLLTRLMVHDRKQIEMNLIDAINSDDLLLRLNLISIYAATGDDLRFLDALNYYYELLPATWRPRTRHNWLLVTYLALYARALAAWI